MEDINRLSESLNNEEFMEDMPKSANELAKSNTVINKFPSKIVVEPPTPKPKVYVEKSSTVIQVVDNDYLIPFPTGFDRSDSRSTTDSSDNEPYVEAAAEPFDSPVKEETAPELVKSQPIAEPKIEPVNPPVNSTEIIQVEAKPKTNLSRKKSVSKLNITLFSNSQPEIVSKQDTEPQPEVIQVTQPVQSKAKLAEDVESPTKYEDLVLESKAAIVLRPTSKRESTSATREISDKPESEREISNVEEVEEMPSTSKLDANITNIESNSHEREPLNPPKEEAETITTVIQNDGNVDPEVVQPKNVELENDSNNLVIDQSTINTNAQNEPPSQSDFLGNNEKHVVEETITQSEPLIVEQIVPEVKDIATEENFQPSVQEEHLPVPQEAQIIVEEREDCSMSNSLLPESEQDNHIQSEPIPEESTVNIEESVKPSSSKSQVTLKKKRSQKRSRKRAQRTQRSESTTSTTESSSEVPDNTEAECNTDDNEKLKEIAEHDKVTRHTSKLNRKKGIAKHESQKYSKLKKNFVQSKVDKKQERLSENSEDISSDNNNNIKIEEIAEDKECAEEPLVTEKNEEKMDDVKIVEPTKEPEIKQQVEKATEHEPKEMKKIKKSKSNKKIKDESIKKHKEPAEDKEPKELNNVAEEKVDDENKGDKQINELNKSSDQESVDKVIPNVKPNVPTESKKETILESDKENEKQSEEYKEQKEEVVREEKLEQPKTSTTIQMAQNKQSTINQGKKASKIPISRQRSISKCEVKSPEVHPSQSKIPIKTPRKKSISDQPQNTKSNVKQPEVTVPIVPEEKAKVQSASTSNKKQEKNTFRSKSDPQTITVESNTDQKNIPEETANKNSNNSVNIEETANDLKTTFEAVKKQLSDPTSKRSHLVKKSSMDSTTSSTKQYSYTKSLDNDSDSSVSDSNVEEILELSTDEESYEEFEDDFEEVDESATEDYEEFDSKNLKIAEQLNINIAQYSDKVNELTSNLNHRNNLNNQSIEETCESEEYVSDEEIDEEEGEEEEEEIQDPKNGEMINLNVQVEVKQPTEHELMEVRTFGDSTRYKTSFKTFTDFSFLL